MMWPPSTLRRVDESGDLPNDHLTVISDGHLTH